MTTIPGTTNATTTTVHKITAPTIKGSSSNNRNTSTAAKNSEHEYKLITHNYNNNMHTSKDNTENNTTLTSVP